MEFIIFIVFIALVFALIGMPVWTVLTIKEMREKLEGTRRELAALKSEQQTMQRRLAGMEAAAAQVAKAETSSTKTVVSPTRERLEAAPSPPTASPSPTPPPMPPLPAARPTALNEPPAMAAETTPPAQPAKPTPSSATASTAAPAASQPRRPGAPPIPQLTMEQFIGGKLLAWVGGLVLFLGVIFFVKLSIERGWLPPGLRVLIGFITGLGLLAGGWWSQRWPRYQVLTSTLCATGIVVLYGVSFAAHSLYRIPPFDHALVTFAVMSMVTVTAFWLAVQQDARVIAVLGMLGGFLTPVLCSTGQDNPFGLFSYIALLDLGVLTVSGKKKWAALPGLAAAGTILMQWGWSFRFFETSHYGEGAATWIPILVFMGFSVLFATAAGWRKENDGTSKHLIGPAVAVAAGAMAAAFEFLAHRTILERPWVLYPFVFSICLTMLGLVWRRPQLAGFYHLFSGLTFLHLVLWTESALTRALLPAALGLYLIFGLIQSGYLLLTPASQKGSASARTWAPLLSLVLMLLCVITLPSTGLTVWPGVLLADLLVLALALQIWAPGTVLGALVLTMITAGLWLCRGHGETGNQEASLTSFLVIIGSFAVLFTGAGTFLARRYPKDPAATWLPASAAVMPFALLILATIYLHIPQPSPVFGMAGLLVIFLLLLARFAGMGALAPTALVCVLALEGVWHLNAFDPSLPVTPLLWYLGFYLLFTAWPFLFRRLFAEQILPWITGAAAGVGTFPMVYQVVKKAWPNPWMGLVPAAFAVAPLLSLAWILKKHPVQNPARLSQLAWYGGVSLGFLTLITPIQFEKQWITLGWAMEGAALCWLFRRVPHPGLRALGALLLTVAFVRLALNPAVFIYQVRGDTPILNWQLYAYSLTIAALCAATAWLKPPHHLINEINLRALFPGMAVVLLFLLLNIEIADVFTPAGSRSIAFDFQGNFGRDMTYTIAWSLFALGLLMAGFWKRLAPVRYAGIGLLAIALLKLFLHDLDNIGSSYRIGAFMIVAVIALAASFLYQRFQTETKPVAPLPHPAGPESDAAPPAPENPPEDPSV